MAAIRAALRGALRRAPLASPLPPLPRIPPIRSADRARRIPRPACLASSATSQEADAPGGGQGGGRADVGGEEAGGQAPPLPPVAALDVRVGRIVAVEVHPDADNLYVESIDVGEEAPRTIVSGLVNYVPIEELKDRRVTVLCNLKPRNMRGVKSHGMLLAASDASHEVVEPLDPPEGAAVGERVWFGEPDPEGQAPPEPPNRLQKKKIWEKLQPKLGTNGERVATFNGAPMSTSAGAVTAATLVNASIS
ncbi:unnamed protein product [Ostreobium quekettii]|uniref:tRNA-binding domain-containing protein n=1 Tax=Ostreobium quekettii TaxID=121088 RepID=A0A8S1J148_9CHLO|nr:unnamed protein product [Ostreobium quekettii]|eukprot:evm.model.scf_270.3 EVM.evm.TU.scf_270.3   scf_270:25361-27641(-)